MKLDLSDNNLKVLADWAKGCSFATNNFYFTYFINLSCYVVLYSEIDL